MNRLRLFLLPLLMLITATASQAVVDGKCNFTQGSTTTTRGFLNCDEELAVRPRSVATIAALRLLTTALAPETSVYVTEWNTGTLLGGGIFYRDGTTGGVDNGGTLIVDASSRNWKRLAIDVITPEMFSADANPATDDSAALQATLDYMETVGGRLELPNFYLSTATQAYVSDLPITVKGDGADNSGIIFDVGAGVNGLSFTFSAWNTSGVPELSDFAILTKKAATVAGTALTIQYTTLPGSGSRKGVVVSGLNIQNATGGDIWTRGIFTEQAPHSIYRNNWIQGQSGIASTKIGAGIQCGTWCNGSRIHENKIRGFLNGFYVTSTFASPVTFQFEGVSFIGNTISNNDNGINIDLWALETGIRITSNALDNSITNVRAKNLVNMTIADNGMFWNGQIKTHTDILLITTADDAGGLAAAGQGRNSITGNLTARDSDSNVITGITQANPAVVTYSGTDNWVNDHKVFITAVVGMTEVNLQAFTIKNVNTGANTFELRNEADTANIDSTAYGAYSSGGIVEAFSIGIDVQGGNSNLVAENNVISRSIGIRLGSLVNAISVNRNALSADITLLNNMSTSPEEAVVGRSTDADVLEELAVGAGLRLSAGSILFAPEELALVTWGTAASHSQVFDVGATDPVVAYTNPGNMLLSATGGASARLILEDQASLRFREEAAGGNDQIIIQAPATLAADRTCTLEDDATPFDPCITAGGGGGDSITVEDGDNGGTFSATVDADLEDSGDINFVLTGNDISGLVRGNSVALTTDTSGNYADGDAEGGAALTGDTATDFFAAGTFADARVDGSLEIDEVITAALGGTGIDVAAQIADFDATELSALTWGAAGGTFTWTMNAGATDIIQTFSDTGNYTLGTSDGSALSTILDDQGLLKFREEAANGTNNFSFQAPAAITSNVSCVFENDANFIPDSCVGDGTDAGGTTPFTRVSGASGAAGGDVTLQTLTANCTANATTTPAVCMTTTGVGAGVWKYEYSVRYQSSATTTGIGLSINHTGTTGAFVSKWQFISTGAAAATGVADQVSAVNTGQMMEGKSERVKNTVSSSSAGVDTINVDMLAIVQGIIVVTVSGSLELKHNSETANSTQVMDDTNLVLTKME